MNPRGHNKVFLDNAKKIKHEYLRILNAEGRLPSQQEVAANIGLTQVTISKHMNSINIDELLQTYKLFTPDVLQGLTDKAISGDVSAVKFFLFLVHDVTEQINIKEEKNVKITKEITVKVDPAIAKKVGDAIAREAEFEIIGEKTPKLISGKVKGKVKGNGKPKCKAKDESEAKTKAKSKATVEREEADSYQSRYGGEPGDQW